MNETIKDRIKIVHCIFSVERYIQFFFYSGSPLNCLRHSVETNSSQELPVYDKSLVIQFFRKPRTRKQVSVPLGNLLFMGKHCRHFARDQDTACIDTNNRSESINSHWSVSERWRQNGYRYKIVVMIIDKPQHFIFLPFIYNRFWVTGLRFLIRSPYWQYYTDPISFFFCG